MQAPPPVSAWEAVGIVLAAAHIHEQRWVSLPCPQCQSLRSRANQHARPLRVQPALGLYVCHHCNWRGSVQPLRQLHSTDRHSPPKDPGQPKTFIYAPGMLSETARAWLERRGITLPTVRQRQIGWATVSLAGRPQPALTFPYFDASGTRCVNIKYRTLDKHFGKPGGGAVSVYGLERVKQQSVILLVEGELDVLACDMAQVPIPVVSMPDGSSSVDNTIQGLTPILGQLDRILLAGDQDAPGEQAMQELARRLGQERCWRVRWPDPCKDANDTLIQQGPDGIWTAIAQAQPWPVQGLVTVRSLASQLDHVYQHGLQRGALLPWPKLRQLYSVKLGELTVLSGMPGAGKSTFLAAIISALAQSQGWHTLMFTPEHEPWRMSITQIEQYIGKPFDDLPNAPRMSLSAYRAGRAWLDQHVTYLLPDPEEAKSASVASVLELARVGIHRYGSRILSLDPWNQMEHTRPPHQTEREHISESLTLLLRFAKKYSVHIFIVAHPRKLEATKKGDRAMDPLPYDIAGAADWFNKADNMLLLSQPPDLDAVVNVRVAKVKFREVGRVGTASLRFDSATGRFHGLYTDAPAPS